ncbi:hypothetical protein O6H91_08G068300 [Diphasiastrum complanatum]|uniref:Uncharacterized protein n=1 Tax=Diphasiastrum complanatum TaxID=34168 RepID=A0ACC2CYH7_DIPCM|nr:hypothetical protein O6H91_08G068300 [Diphasiastrum complanatum]
MASEADAADVESPAVADAEATAASVEEPTAPQHSDEPEGESSTNEVPAEAEGESSEKEEVAQDATEESVDNTEPESDEADDSDKSLKITVDDIKTAPIDFRFPTTNQAKHCFTRYNEYHKCVKEKGEDNSDCEKYARWYRSLCPGEWIERWNEQRENGTFPGRY